MTSERERFEAWIREAEPAGFVCPLDRVDPSYPDEDGNEYAVGRVEVAWRAWQARAALPAPADQSSHASADSGQGQAADGETLWLWKNGDHFLAFRHLYPCFTPNGDPMTLGEPVGRAVFRHSHNREGRNEHANYLHAGNAAQGNQLWPAGRPLGGGAADGVAGAVAAQAAQVRMDGVHGALGRASLGRSIDPAASAFDVEAFLREWCDYWRLRALDYEDAYKNLRDYAEKNGLDTVTHGPRRKDHP